jgi:hypothetical protein
MASLFTIAILSMASTVSTMTKYVENERIAGERRMDALYSKKTETLCPGYSNKGMSLCVRQYIKNYKIETASAYTSLTNFVQITANQDRNAKIYDALTAQLISFETLILLQEQLKKENMLCGSLRPSGIQHLLEIKQICASEEEQFRKQQEKNKKYIQDRLVEIKGRALASLPPNARGWHNDKTKELQLLLKNNFEKKFYTEQEYKISAKDIVNQHKTTIKTSCEKLDIRYKALFNQQNPCEVTFSALLMSCVGLKDLRHPASMKDKELAELVQQPLSCFYGKVQEYLTERKL